MPFTLVFDGELSDFKENPFKTLTPFGFPTASSVGDALEKNDRLTEALEKIADDSVDVDVRGRADILSGIAWAALGDKRRSDGT